MERNKSSWIRAVIGSIAAFAGVSLALAWTIVGHCSAMGGRCPAEPTPLLENDVFRLVALTIATTTLVVSLCLRPDWKGATAGAGVAVAIGLLSGFLAATVARG